MRKKKMFLIISILSALSCATLSVHAQSEITKYIAPTTGVEEGGIDTYVNASGDTGIVTGGNLNEAYGNYSTITGGYNNTSTNSYTTVVGGDGNNIESDYGTIVGGSDNIISTDGDNNTIVGGKSNDNSGEYSSIVSGTDNHILDSDSTFSTIVGGEGNSIELGECAIIVGGSQNYSYGNYNAVIGGNDNSVNAESAILIGGISNTTSSDNSTIIGGRSTTISDKGKYSTIIGGINSIASGKYTTVIGGGFASANFATAIGYESNSTTTNGVAIGYQAVQNVEGTVSFGHVVGDAGLHYISLTNEEKENLRAELNKQHNEHSDAYGNLASILSSYNNIEAPDYLEIEDDIQKLGYDGWLEKTLSTTTKAVNTYDSDGYNRLVKVADGVDDHDVTTVGQVKKMVAAAGGGGGTSIKASDDVSISSDNTISIAKNGQIASGDSGIVTGDTVYKVTNKLNDALTDQGTSITAANNKITSLNTTMEKMRNSMVEMNTSISNTIADLPGSLTNFINKDLSNLSTDGQNTLKALIKSEIKNQMGASNSVSSVSTMDGSFMVQAVADTSYVDNAVAGKADKAEFNKLADTVATKADKKDLDALATKVDTKADLSYVNTELTKKADQSTVDSISTKVDANSKSIQANTEAIKGNTTAIADLKENKADVSGANIDVSAWSEKLGTGKVAKDDAGLVTGGTVFNALEEKADVGYVNAGFQAMGTQMQEMNQALTRDINKVGAGAAALAGLHPQEYDPDSKLDFAVGYGHYHNANATALGMYYRPNAVTTLSLAGTIGNGDPMVSAGLSFKLGMGKHVEKVMVTKDDFNAMQNRMANQDEEIANQKEKIAQLEIMVKQLMAK